MAVFSYQAVTPQGETRSGTVTASSEQEAVARIQTMGLMVMSVASGAGSVWKSGNLEIRILGNLVT